jgi:hypothetical protein
MPDNKRRPLVVSAALIALRTTDGRVNYYYRGAAIPDGMRDADVERLLADGLIAPEDGILPGVAPPPL